jgi:hypothetical protein
VSAVRVLGRAAGPAGVHEVRDGAVRDSFWSRSSA